MQKLAAIFFAVSLSACASSEPAFHIAISRGATLYIESPDGERIAPMQGNFLYIDGRYGLESDGIRLNPGIHYIKFSCPSGSLPISHGGPEISHEFESDKKYVLRCRDGFAHITQLE